MRIFLRLGLLHFLLFSLFSCKKYKPSDAAFFIRTEEVKVAVNTYTQGSSSNKISDLWLYVNGQFRGAYPVGNVMPVPLKDNHAQIVVFAGIKNNSLNETRIPWQFYQRYDLDTAVQAGTTIKRNFTFSYNPATVFSLVEGFEPSSGFQSAFKVKDSPISNVSYTTTATGSADSFEGQSLLLDLGTSSVNTIGQIESSQALSLPLGNGNVYLELNYKCNSEFSIGVFGADNIQRNIITLRPTSTWNKVYVSLADVINQSPTYAAYTLYFKLLRTGDSDAQPKMFLDNIKVVYIA